MSQTHRLAATVFVALAVGMVVALFGAADAHAVCAGSAVQWKGAVYTSAPTIGAVPAGPALTAKAAEIPCNDTPGTPQPRPVANLVVHRVPGIPTAAAIVVGDDRRTLYLAQGFFPDAASHPAYRYLEHPTLAVEGWRCDLRARSLGGTHRPGFRPAFAFTVASAPWLKGLIHDGLVFPRVVGASDLTGLLRRTGLPFARSGERLEATVSVCRAGGRPAGLVVRSLRHAPRVRLKVKVQRAGATRSQSFRVECGPAAGDAPDPAKVCRAIATTPSLTRDSGFVEGPCFPGAYRVSVTGRVGDRKVDILINGCDGPGRAPPVRWLRLLGIAAT